MAGKQAEGIRHRAAARRRRRAARCSARRRWRVRNAAPRIPSASPNSARPPARRCGAARPAANRSIISSVIERMPYASRASTADRQRCAARDARRGVDGVCDAAGAGGRLSLSRPASTSPCARPCDGEEMRRSYSICSGPDDGELRIAVKKVDGGAFSNWAADELKAGDELDVMTPTGRFGIAPCARRGADLCRLCRRLRHHADPVDRARACWRASPTAASSCSTATARQRACCSSKRWRN